MSKRDSSKVVIASNGWSFEGSWGSRRGGVPLLGLFLIVFGLLLVAGEFVSLAEYGTAAFLLAIGVVLIVSGIRDKSDLSLYGGVFMAALAVASFLSAAGLIHGDGWGTLFVGIGFMGVSIWRPARGIRIGWAFILGAVLALWGGLQVAESSFSFPTGRLIGPVLIILLGLWIVSRRARR
jgi:hypothetical protein